MLNNAIDKSVDFFFSKDNRKWVLLFFLIGLILRILIALRLPFNADEMVHGTHAIGFIESGKLQIMDQDAVWFFLTNLSMKIIGFDMLGIRFLSVLFGALTIILVYLTGKEFFNEKIGLIASFIFAISPFQLFETRAEMDITMFFFVLLAIYLTILFFKTNHKKYFYLSWIALGISVMVKQIAVTFIPAFIIFYLYYNKKKNGSFKIKQLITAGLILLLLVTPVLTFNYLLYKDKGILDLQFARFTKIGFETYESIAPTIQPFALNSLLFDYGEGLPGFIEGFTRIFHYETIILLFLSLLGLFYIKEEVKEKDHLYLFALTFIFPYLFLAGTSLLTTHLVFATYYFSILSSVFIVSYSNKIKSNKNRKNFVYLIIGLILIFSLYNVYSGPLNGFYGKNELEKIIEFKENQISENSLVVVDSRYYRGRIAFMFWDKHYLESSLFQSLISSEEKILQSTVPIETYFIQCVNTDCGWGTIKDQPEFNQSQEAIVQLFKENSQLVYEGKDIYGEPYFKIYKQNFNFNPQILNVADSSHDWFFYPVAYEKASFDDYEINGSIDSLLDQISYLILILEVLIALISILYVSYLFYKSS